MANMITAAEARAKATEAVTALTDETFIALNQKIEQAAAKGETRITLTLRLTEATKAALESKGFKVSCWDDQRDPGPYASIEW